MQDRGLVVSRLSVGERIRLADRLSVWIVVSAANRLVLPGAGSRINESWTDRSSVGGCINQSRGRYRCSCRHQTSVGVASIRWGGGGSSDRWVVDGSVLGRRYANPVR